MNDLPGQERTIISFEYDLYTVHLDAIVLSITVGNSRDFLNKSTRAASLYTVPG
jgi:hypothetical protein